MERSRITEAVERKVRKEVRLHRLISKADRILAVDDGTLKAKVTLHILGGMLKELHANSELKIIGDIPKEVPSGFDKVVIPWTMDDECAYFLSSVMEGANPDRLSHYVNDGAMHVKLLIGISDKECEAYASFNGIGGTDIARDDEASKLIGLMDSAYGDTRHSLLNCIGELKRKKII